MKKAFPELTGLKGLLALVILTHHICGGIPNNTHPVIQLFAGQGSLAVDCFMAIGGFLFAMNYYPKIVSGESGSAFRFMGKRMGKLYPDYILALIFCYIYKFALKKIVGTAYDLSALHVLLNLLMLPCGIIAPASDFSAVLNEVSWYLSVMMLFTLLSYMISSVNNKTHTAYWAVGIIFLCVIIPANGWSFPLLNLHSYRGIGFMVGLLMGLYYDELCALSRHTGVVLLSLAALGIWGYLVIRQVPDTILITALVAIPAFALLLCAWKVLRRLLSFKPLLLLGKYSYSLYLWHLPLFYLFRYHVLIKGANISEQLPHYLILTVLVTVVGYWSARGLERLVREKWKARDCQIA